MILGVPKETFPREKRVAIIPEGLSALSKAGIQVLIQADAGNSAGYGNKAYEEKGGRVVSGREEIFSAEVILQVRTLGANPVQGREDLAYLHEGHVVIGHADPLSSPRAAQDYASKKASLFALELMPRISRAQSMDVLSSMATVSGYKAVLLAAEALPRMFPMFMTAAGTITPARVFVVGAGVAGLQAIATARRLGAVVKAYDVRPAVKEQVESLGAKFVELSIGSKDSEDKGGYAKAMDDSFYQKQRELMAQVVADSDVVITTAAVPGKKAPVLITTEMVRGMAKGSVVVDLAAERGGNCEACVPGETANVNGVAVLGPVNLPSSVPYHASQMYSKNIITFLLNMVKDGTLKVDTQDEIVRETLVSHEGQVVHPKIKELLGPGESS